MDIRTKTSELLEENIEGKFFDIGLSDEFLDLKPKIKTTKLKTSKWDSIRLKSFHTAKETLPRMKSNLLSGGKYLQILCLTRYSYPKYINNSYNSIAKQTKKIFFNVHRGASLMGPWSRVCLPMQETRVQYLVQKIPHVLEQLSPCTTPTEPML